MFERAGLPTEQIPGLAIAPGIKLKLAKTAVHAAETARVRAPAGKPMNE
jgi:hypothetical protein